jgi:hypothetical protein
MSLSSVGSLNPYSYLQWPQQPGSADSADPPTDPLQALYQAFTGGKPQDPLINADGSGDGDGGSGCCCDGASNGCPPFSPGVMTALLAAQGGQGSSRSSRLQALFGKFDSDGNGQISQSEFESATGPGADRDKVDALFAKLDGNGDGSVTEDELQSALQKARGGHHHHSGAGAQAAGAQGGDPLQALLSSASTDGATTQTSTNADGSTTTTITYADGSKIDMTIPAATDTNGSAGVSTGQSGLDLRNFLERLISMQAQLIAPTTDLAA